jgi:hypothetical protein
MSVQPISYSHAKQSKQIRAARFDKQPLFLYQVYGNINILITKSTRFLAINEQLQGLKFTQKNTIGLSASVCGNKRSINVDHLT